MKKILLFLSVLTVFVGALVPTDTAFAGTPGTTTAAPCSARFLGLRPWWDGLTMSGTDCSISSDKIQTNGLPWFFGVLAMNILENITILAGYAAVGFIMYGGFRYATAAGSPDNIAKAKKTIQNAVIGLVIAIFATVAINIVFNVLGL